MKRLIFIIVSVLLIGLLALPVACARAPEEQSQSMPSGAPAPMAPGFDTDETDKNYGEGNSVTSPDTERLIVQTGNIALVVDDVALARNEIASLAASYNGYVVSSRIWGEEQEKRGVISIRVPEDKFETVLSELREMAVRVDSENAEGRDVTEEYVDLKSRLKNAEATENQYLVLLEKSEDVEDILKIYEKLSQVRSEIEQLKGRIQYLERTSSMSLISVSLEPVASSKPLVRVWNITEAFKTAIRGIVVFGQWLVTTLIWVVIFAPLWGTILGIILWRRRRKKQS